MKLREVLSDITKLRTEAGADIMDFDVLVPFPGLQTILDSVEYMRKIEIDKENKTISFL